MGPDSLKSFTSPGSHHRLIIRVALASESSGLVECGEERRGSSLSNVEVDMKFSELVL